MILFTGISNVNETSNTSRNNSRVSKDHGSDEVVSFSSFHFSYLCIIQFPI